jgi:predicted transcriptional regulator
MRGHPPKVNPLSSPMSLRLYPELDALLDWLARQRQCSKSRVVLDCIENDLLRQATYRLSYDDGIRLMQSLQEEVCTTVEVTV